MTEGMAALQDHDETPKPAEPRVRELPSPFSLHKAERDFDFSPRIEEVGAVTEAPKASPAPESATAASSEKEDEKKDDDSEQTSASPASVGKAKRIVKESETQSSSDPKTSAGKQTPPAPEQSETVE